MKKTRTLLMALALGLGMNAYAGEPEFPTGKVVAFSPDGGTTWQYYDQQPVDDPYVFTPETGQTGVLAFNPNVAKIEVVNDFQLNGADFEIKTATGQTVSFAQPLVNYTTAVTVTGQGTIETQGAAAFSKITVGNGAQGDTPTLKIGSQIGVTGDFTVQSGAKLELDSNSHLLLTQQIANEGTIQLNSGAVIDASNLSHEAAQALGIEFEGTDKKISENGSGFLHGDSSTNWEISTGNGEVVVPEESAEASKLVVGNLIFNISDGGSVHHTATDYSIWFQNGDTSPALSEIILAAPDNKVSFMVNPGGDTQTEILVDGQISGNNIVAVTRGTKALINMVDNPPSFESMYFAISELKVYDMVDVTITGWSGVMNHVNNATFIGQGIKLSTTDHPIGFGDEFDPMNLTVETASSATIDADIVSPYGYFEGDNFASKCIKEDHPDVIPGEVHFLSGQYDLRGALTIGEGHKIDLREAYGTEYFTSAERDKTAKTVTDIVFQEEFLHLTMSETGALALQDKAVFLASSVSDDSTLTDGGMNLDTTRKLAAAHYREYQDWQGSWQYDIVDGEGNIIDPNTLEKYTVNGTVEIRSSEDTGTAKITSIGEIAGHYTTRNMNFSVANAEITVNDQISDLEGAYEGPKVNTTISNALNGDSVINDKQTTHGTVTLDNMQNRSFKTIHAKEGDIAITNREAIPVQIEEVKTWIPEDVSADTVWIGAGKTVSATGHVLDELKRATVNVDTMLKADGSVGNYSVLDANLRMGMGSTLDVSAANGTGGIDMQGNKVTFGGEFGDAPLTLSADDYAQAWAMEKGGKYDLFHNVSAFAMYSGAEPWSEPALEDWELDASNFFSNLKEGWFYLCYSGANEQGGNGRNVGTIYLYSLVPEPTTGTLSLLALAALAARRRRK